MPRPLSRRHVPGWILPRLAQRHDIGLGPPAPRLASEVDRRIDQELRLAAIERRKGQDMDFDVAPACFAKGVLQEGSELAEHFRIAGHPIDLMLNQKGPPDRPLLLLVTGSTARNCTAAGLSLSIIRQENSVPSSVQSTLPG